MSILYIIWVMYCISPMALVMFLFYQHLVKSTLMFTDIEYVGGPDDGHRTIGQEDEVFISYRFDMLVLHKYKRTGRRNTEGFLVYEYAGSTLCDES